MQATKISLRWRVLASLLLVMTAVQVLLASSLLFMCNPKQLARLSTLLTSFTTVSSSSLSCTHEHQVGNELYRMYIVCFSTRKREFKEIENWNTCKQVQYDLSIFYLALKPYFLMPGYILTIRQPSNPGFVSTIFSLWKIMKKLAEGTTGSWYGVS